MFRNIFEIIIMSWSVQAPIVFEFKKLYPTPKEYFSSLLYPNFTEGQ
ncbi:hypothetical protein [Flavobacterium hibisci]|nr:hypothetical protein [Flavobacterium hibisci]MBZ4042084.1 hypothetical protein [Flavobacterium hibisci]